MRQNEQTSSIPVANATFMNSDWMQQLNSQLETRDDNSIVDLDQSTIPATVSNSVDATGKNDNLIKKIKTD